MLDADRATTRAAAAVRSAEGLVQVDVHHVEAQVARSRDAHDGVKIRAVAIHQATGFVDDLGYFQQIFVEQAERIGVGQHQTGCIRPGHFAQVVEVYVAASVALDRDHLEATHGRRRRVRTVGSVRHQDFSAPGVALAPGGKARIVCTPTSSPCAPAAGCSVTASKPAISAR